MERNITNLQSLWKTKKSNPLNLDTLINDIQVIEKKGKIERTVLIIAIPITIILLATILPVFSNIHYLIATVLISFGMLMLLLQSFRSKVNLIDNYEGLNNHKYIETLIMKLKQRMLTTSRYMWIYTFLLILGLNIGYIDIIEKFNLPLFAKISIHITISIVFFYLMHYGIKKRIKEHEMEITPLIHFLKSIH